MALERTTYQGYTLVSLHDPGPDELESVKREFGLPEPLIEDLVATVRRSTIEAFGGLLLAVVKTTTWVAAEEAVRLGEVRLVIGDGFPVSLERGTAVLARARQDLEAQPELAGDGPAALLPCIVAHAVEGYGPVLGALGDAVEEVEEAVFSPGQSRPTERIYRLSRQVLELRRAMAPPAELLDLLASEPATPVGDRPRRRLRKQRSRLVHLVDEADGLGTLLSNALQANQTEVSLSQNDDMRRISAWVAIWAVPTLLAGIYGMNFRHLPELEWAFGYPVVLVAMLAICLALYRGFRRNQWL